MGGFGALKLAFRHSLRLQSLSQPLMLPWSPLISPSATTSGHNLQEGRLAI
jgi:hypothetical protein